MKSKYDYGNLVIRKAMEASGPGLNLDASKAAINDALVALTRQAKALAETDYSNQKPDILGRTFAYTGKVIDTIFRLSCFASGNADSRPEVLGLDALLAVLTNEQLHELTRKMELDYGVSEDTQGAIQEADLV